MLKKAPHLSILFWVIALFMICSCSNNAEKQNDELSKSKRTHLSDSLSIKSTTDEKLLHDSLQAAMKRIKIFDYGIGSNSEVHLNYSKEQELWLSEIELIYQKLLRKIETDFPESKESFVESHLKWIDYIESLRLSVTGFIENNYRSGESIFHVMSFYRTEYENKLSQYYYLYYLDETQ